MAAPRSFLLFCSLDLLSMFAITAVGTGAALLADALQRIAIATQTVAARFVVVDARHENAVGFYEHHGFKRIPGTLRLVQKLSDVAKSLNDR